MDFGRARDVVKQYGSDFFQGILQMPSDMQKAIVVLYQFVRVPDQMIDDASIQTQAQKEQARQSIQNYYERRKNAYDSNNLNDEEFGAVVRVFRTYGIDFQYSVDFFDSMLLDTVVQSYATYDDLKKYIYGSAEVIGLMMVQIMGCNFDESDPEYLDKHAKVMRCAAKLGEAFQLSNFLRDVHEDFLFGRVYIPQDTLATYHIDQHDLQRYHETQSIDDKFALCMRSLVERVDAMHDEANEGIPLLNPACHKAIQLSSDLHRGILKRIKDCDYNVFDASFQKDTFGRIKLV